jgi:hypothetical protein
MIYCFKKLRIIPGYITSSLKHEPRVSTVISRPDIGDFLLIAPQIRKEEVSECDNNHVEGD